MKNFYFDLCSIPIFILIIYAYFDRNMTRFKAFSLFFVVDVISIVCSILDILMEFTVNPLPLSENAVFWGTIISFSYKYLRNSSMVLYLIFIFMVTKTDYRIRTPLMRTILWLPNLIVIGLLLANFFNHSVFTVTGEYGYQRGPLLLVLYAIALLYEIAGVIYLFTCRKYLENSKWLALMSVYFLTFVAVGIQFVYPDLMVEMFSSAIGMLMIMLLVMRPEETLDLDVGVQSYRTFQRDLHNVTLTREKIDILVIHSLNAIDNRVYLGEDSFKSYAARFCTIIREHLDKLNVNHELYFENPDNIYVTIDKDDGNIEEIAASLNDVFKEAFKDDEHRDIWTDIQVLLLKYPKDLRDEKELYNLAHRFSSLIVPTQRFTRAETLVRSSNFIIHNHIEDILADAINTDSLKVYYQPIYDVRHNRFSAAEALARIDDPKYGMISPIIFIPEAEKNGMIVPLGKKIIEAVYRFISEHDLKELGLDYLEINLSVAQCLQNDLPDDIARLQEKYHVTPDQINFEITESLLSSIGNIMEKNLVRLTEMGYSLSLDDYGVGYSNIRRMRKFPIELIKVDKTMVDDIFTEEGSVIIRNTVNMMQGINKKLVMEGAEDEETVRMLKNLSCEYIQGFYYSKPLPEEDFVNFIKEHNTRSA